VDNQLQALLWSDAGDAPGSVLASYTMTGVPGPPAPMSLWLVPAGPGQIVTAGQQYWFSVTGGAQTFAIWDLTLFQGDTIDGGASRLVTDGAFQPWIVGDGTRTGALRVSGNPVPEPGTASLVAALGLVLAWRRRR
jgi:hypothetical protein